LVDKENTIARNKPKTRLQKFIYAQAAFIVGVSVGGMLHSLYMLTLPALFPRIMATEEAFWWFMRIGYAGWFLWTVGTTFTLYRYFVKNLGLNLFSEEE